MKERQKGICRVCGRRMSTYNRGTQCFFHSVADESRNFFDEGNYHPVKYIDITDGSPKVRISEGCAWRLSANRISE